jgi:hypothetical protein
VPELPLDEAYLARLREQFPRLRVVDKAEDSFSKLLDVGVRAVTFGGQSAFMTRYVTTIGRTIYLPSRWRQRSPESRYCTLRHEAVHLRQFQRYGLVGTALIYLLPVLPLGLAYGRARLEWEAYAETLRAHAEVYGVEAARDPALHAHIRRQFTTAAYGWMWPFAGAVQRWIDAEVAALVENPRGSS